jgi:hypothetical protein
MTRFRDLRSVFRSDAPSLAHGYIAQLIVLYEDLRIEMHGITDRDLGELDSTDKKIRVHYFLRRSIGTWCEFAEAIRLLNALDEFTRIKHCFDQPSIKKWDKAVRYFRRHERFVKSVRNDIGGHFGGKAAMYAVEHLPPAVVGKFEITSYDSTHAGARLCFAGDIAAAATFRALPAGSTKDEWGLAFRRLLRIVRTGWRYGTYSTDSIAAHYLWPRFG